MFDVYVTRSWEIGAFIIQFARQHLLSPLTSHFVREAKKRVILPHFVGFLYKMADI